MSNNFPQFKEAYVLSIKMENKLLLTVAIVLASFAGKILLIISYLTFTCFGICFYRKRQKHMIEYLWHLAILNKFFSLCPSLYICKTNSQSIETRIYMVFCISGVEIKIIKVLCRRVQVNSWRESENIVTSSF